MELVAWMVHLLWWLTCVFMAPMYVGSMIYTTSANVFIGHYALGFYWVFAVLLIMSFYFSARFATRMRRKSYARFFAYHRITECDMESDNERPEVEYPRPWTLANTLGFLSRNIASFCKYYIAYGIILGFGIMCLVFAEAFYISGIFTSELLREDLLYSATYILIPGVALTVSVPCLANILWAYEKHDEGCRYIKYKIRVPMKYLFKKMFLEYRGGFACWFTAAFIASTIGLIYGLYIGIAYMTNSDDIRSTNFKYLLAQPIACGVLGLIFLVCLSYILYEKARQALLKTMKENWQQNLYAIKTLLEDVRIDNLKDLRDHIEEMSENSHLPLSQLQAVYYLKRPLWKAKLPYTRHD